MGLLYWPNQGYNNIYSKGKWNHIIGWVSSIDLTKDIIIYILKVNEIILLVESPLLTQPIGYNNKHSEGKWNHTIGWVSSIDPTKGIIIYYWR